MKEDYTDVKIICEANLCVVQYGNLNDEIERLELDARDETSAKLEASAMLDFPEDQMEVEYV